MRTTFVRHNTIYFLSIAINSSDLSERINKASPRNDKRVNGYHLIEKAKILN